MGWHPKRKFRTRDLEISDAYDGYSNSDTGRRPDTQTSLARYENRVVVEFSCIASSDV
jgi:hypothetical protein